MRRIGVRRRARVRVDDWRKRGLVREAGGDEEGGDVAAVRDCSDLWRGRSVSGVEGEDGRTDGPGGVDETFVDACVVVPDVGEFGLNGLGVRTARERGRTGGGKMSAGVRAGQRVSCGLPGRGEPF